MMDVKEIKKELRKQLSVVLGESDKLTEKAIREEARAEEYLLLEIDRVERQQGQNNFMQFTTYGTTIQTPI